MVLGDMGTDSVPDALAMLLADRSSELGEAKELLRRRDCKRGSIIDITAYGHYFADRTRSAHSDGNGTRRLRACFRYKRAEVDVGAPYYFR